MAKLVAPVGRVAMRPQVMIRQWLLLKEARDLATFQGYGNQGTALVFVQAHQSEKKWFISFHLFIR